MMGEEVDFLSRLAHALFFENLHEITGLKPDAVSRLMQTMSSPQISGIVENLASLEDDIVIGKIGALVETIARDRCKKS